MGKMMSTWKIWLVQFMVVWVVCLVTDVGGVRDFPATELSSAAAVDSSELLVPPSPLHLLRRSDFPKGFVFGTSSASYQVRCELQLTWFWVSTGMISLPVSLGMCKDFYHNDIPILYSSCLQYEGGVHEGGRGPCVWDTGAHMLGLHFISTFFNVFEALPIHVCSLLECVNIPPKS